MSLVCQQQQNTSWFQPMLSQLLKQCISFGRERYQFQSETKSQLFKTTGDRLPQLPVEIIQLILLHLLKDSRNTFIQALQVSPSWNAIGTPLLWRDISIPSARIDLFVQCLSSSTHNTKYIQTLTLKLTSVALYQAELAGLSQRISQLENLTTFSFSLESTRFSSPSEVDALLRALPTSVTALEINRLPHGLACGPLSHKLCTTLRNILPRLEHLRIDRGHFCDGILPDQDIKLSRLRTILINDSSRSIISVHLCKRAHASSSSSSFSIRTDICGEAIALKARKLIDAGHMPSLESFVIFTSCPFQPLALPHPPIVVAATAAGAALATTEPRPSDDENPVVSGSRHFLRKNILTNKTTSYLHCPTTRNPHIRAMRYYDPARAENVHVTGTYHELKSVLEGEEAWIKTESGVKFPPSFRQTRRSRSDGYTWLGPPALSHFDPWELGSEKIRALGEDVLNPATYDGLRRPFAHD